MMATEAKSPASMYASSASETVRNDKVTSAVRFLRHPNVRTSTVRARMQFLEKKGLTSNEIAEALRRVDPTSNEYALVVAGAADGIKASEAVAGVEETDAVGLGAPGGGVEGGAQRARINQLQAQVTELVEAQESSSWFGYLGPASLLVALGAGIGYLLHRYLPTVSITIGPPPASRESLKGVKADAPSDSGKTGDPDEKKAEKSRKKRSKRSTYDSDDSDYESEGDVDDESRWRKLNAAGGPAAKIQKDGPSKEDFQRLKSEIDNISDEMSISSKANMAILQEIRDALLVRNTDNNPALAAATAVVGGSTAGVGHDSKSPSQPSPEHAAMPIATTPEAKKATAANLGDALARMRESKAGTPAMAARFLKFFLDKIHDNPEDEGLRKLNLGNATLRKALEVDGASDFLMLTGFEREGSAFMFKPPENAEEAAKKLTRSIEALNNFDQVLSAPQNAGTSLYAEAQTDAVKESFPAVKPPAAQMEENKEEGEVQET